MARTDRDPALWWAFAPFVVAVLFVNCTQQAEAAEAPRMDVYAPAEPNGTAVLAVHGGGWYKGSSASMERVCTDIVVPTGATCFAPDYTLSGVAPFPAANLDLLAAVAHIRSLGYEQVGAIGSSAGGNLVAWLASRGVLDAAVLWSAPTDLTVLKDWPPNAIERFAPTRSAKFRASPALQEVTGAVLIIHSRRDPLIPVSQARRLDKSITNVHHLVIYPGSAHGLRLFDAAANLSAEWLASHLSPPEGGPE